MDSLQPCPLHLGKLGVEPPKVVVYISVGELVSPGQEVGVGSDKTDVKWGAVRTSWNPQGWAEILINSDCLSPQ